MRSYQTPAGADASIDANEAPTATRDLRQMAVQRKLQQRRATGGSLDPTTQRRMEGALGADFSDVRVHTDADAHAAGSALGARAFTTGNDVYFRQGELAPGSREGDRLLAHELAHVAHGDGGLRCKDDQGGGGAAETAADKAADGAVDQLHGQAHDQAKPPPFPPGTSGMLTAAVDKLAAGTPVTIVSGDDKKMIVEVQAGGDKVEIPSNEFQFEPNVGDDDVTQKPRDDVYEDYPGLLWGPEGPKPDDVGQGALGDCYLMAAMQAVVARDPGAIKAMFSPQEPNQPQYAVTLYFPDDKGALQPVAMGVDTELPTLKGTDHQAAYADYGKHAGQPGAPLWPALVEKAYAEAMGGYETTGKGGAPANAMTILTGQPAELLPVPDKSGILDKFKQFEKDGKAVTVDTKGGVQSTEQTPFKKGDDGSYQGVLQANDSYCMLQRNTVSIVDATSKHTASISDDGNGKLVGDTIESGTIDYGSGKATLKFKAEQEPDKPENLKATYQYEGLVSSEFHLYGPHAYVFERVDGDNLILKNPWGTEHPKPIPAERVPELFDEIDDVSAKPPAPPAAPDAAAPK